MFNRENRLIGFQVQVCVKSCEKSKWSRMERGNLSNLTNFFDRTTTPSTHLPPLCSPATIYGRSPRGIPPPMTPLDFSSFPNDKKVFPFFNFHISRLSHFLPFATDSKTLWYFFPLFFLFRCGQFDFNSTYTRR